MTRLYTLGHSNRSIGEFVELLRAERRDLVADVRRFPRSRRHPHFDGETLPAALAAYGIEYRHLDGLGGRRSRSLSDELSPNTGWEAAGFRSYADYAMTAPFREALGTLVRLAQTRAPAIMCAEALWWRCHRRIISDYLLLAGLEVIHIIGPGNTRPAELTPGARPQPGGLIHYPPAQARLL